MQYINSNDILYDKQFGFRKGHSTSHAIITLVEKVSKALDTGKIVVGVYLDIRKAFDCVRHSTLLDKLHKIGIRGNLFCLIKSLLHFILLCMYNLLIARQQLLIRFVDVSTTFVIALMKCFLYLTEFKYG